MKKLYSVLAVFVLMILNQESALSQSNSTKPTLIRDGKLITTYVYADSSSKTGAIVEVTTLGNWKVKRKSGEYMSFAHKRIINCEAKTHKFGEAIYYSELDGQGSVIEKSMSSEPAQPIQPSTLPETLAIEYCGEKIPSQQFATLINSGKVTAPDQKTIDDIYGEVAKKNNEQGRVGILVWVNEKGMPFHTSVVNSSGYTSLDEAGQKISMNYKFEPLSVNGKPSKFKTTILVIFKL